MMKKMKNMFKKMKQKRLSPVPQISTPFNMEIKRQQDRWFVSFLILLLVSGFYTYFYLQHKKESEKLVTVYVAQSDIKYPHVLESKDFSTEVFPQNKLPKSFYEKSEKNPLIGQTLIQNILEHEVFLPHHIHPDLDPESVSAKFDESFALAMDEDWFQSKFSEVKENDFIDIVVSNPDSDLDATMTIVTKMKVIDIQEDKNKKTLIINATEEEARSIIFSRGLKLPMQILVRSGVEN